MTEQTQSRSWLLWGGIFAGIMLFVLVVGGVVLAALNGGSSSGTLPSGRSVTTHSDSWNLESRYEKDTVSIKTAGFKIQVTPGRVDVDGQRVAYLDTAAKNVAVDVKSGEITVHADGKWVVTVRR
ncbi:hypothetical protein Enr10x_09890 [Gimesia panareensis]|uniref:FecR protein n=2 Tax=Gimesia panareensis TaxID=2527978 RepID=A0A517Q2A9_9PLAN|nr:hypothetical protein Enr10x_09890 [Gimesia panareensis]